MKREIKTIGGRLLFLLLATCLLLASGCDQKTQEASKTPAATAKPTATPAPTVQALDETKVDMSMDLINIADYFGKITKQVKADWKSDARMISVRADFRYKDFTSLMKLRTDYDYTVIFYSLSSKTELRVELNNAKKDAKGLPEIKYVVIKRDNSSETSMTFEEQKKNPEWILYEYSRPEAYDVFKNYPENYFEGWNMKMSDVVKALIVRSKNEKVTGTGVYISLYYYVQEKTPIVTMYWENGTAKTYFYVEPVTGKKYDKTI